MGAVAVHASRPLALALSPVLVRQGRKVRERTPLLPEAAGERHGLEPAETEGRGVPVMRLLVVGESTAAGVGVGVQRDGLVHQLATQLARRHGVAVDWSARARTGATASYTARELLPGAPTGQHLVVVVLGVNDTLRFRSRRAWRERVLRLLDTLEGHLDPGGRIVLAGIPDLGSFPALPQPLRAVLGCHARALDRQLQRLAAPRPRVLHVPGPHLTGPDLFAVDAFHPSASSYATWAAHLADAIGD